MLLLTILKVNHTTNLLTNPSKIFSTKLAIMHSCFKAFLLGKNAEAIAKIMPFYVGNESAKSRREAEVLKNINIRESSTLREGVSRHKHNFVYHRFHLLGAAMP